MKGIFLAGMFLAAGIVLAEQVAPPTPAKPDKERMAAAREAMLRKTGGFIAPQEVGPYIVVADMQQGAVTAAVAAATAELERTALLPFRYVKRQAEGSVWESAVAVLGEKEVEFAVLVVADKVMPALVAAPEAGWAVVNVTPLLVGASAELAAQRVKQEVWRAACMALGAADSNTPKCVMGPVMSVKELDELGGAANPEYLNKMYRRAAMRGVKMQRPVAYRKAVEEGWAPEPVNEIQQAVWDEVKGKIEPQSGSK